jgi:UDP-N-acetylglucosamine 4,6-dehydratase
MPVCRIEDLAVTMVEELAPQHGYDARDVPIRIIGPNPGEKYHEELMNEEEIRRTIELKRHFVIVPAFRSNCRRVDYTYPNMLDQQPELPYNSSTAAPMSRDELRQYLRDNQFLDA